MFIPFKCFFFHFNISVHEFFRITNKVNTEALILTKIGCYINVLATFKDATILFEKFNCSLLYCFFNIIYLIFISYLQNSKNSCFYKTLIKIIRTINYILYCFFYITMFYFFIFAFYSKPFYLFMMGLTIKITTYD